MQTKFDQILNKLLDRFVNEVVFIELKETHQLNIDGIEMPENISLPVYLDDLAKNIKTGDLEVIPTVGLIKGLVYIVGSRSTIETYEFYKNMLISLNQVKAYGDLNLTASLLVDGINYAESKQYANAILYFSAVNAIDKDNLDALYNMGRAFEDLSLEEGRDELRRLAISCFESCLAIDDNFDLAHFSLGFLYYNEEKYLQAEKHWIKALQLGISDEMREEIAVGLGRVKDKAAYERGYGMILAGRVEEGLEILKTLEDEHDEWWNLLFFIGVGCRMLEQYEDALGYFLKVMTLNTGHIQTMNEIGICLLTLGDYNEAERYFKEAIRLSPQNSELVCNLGIVHFHRGDLDEARRLFDKANELAPDDEVAKMWLDHINKKLM